MTPSRCPLWSLLIALSCAACAADDAQPESEPSPKAGDERRSAAPETPASAKDRTGPDTEPTKEPAGMSEKAGSVNDRCLIPPCEASALPPRPDLEFLAEMGDGWQRLVEADWEIAAGAEGYRCMTYTIPEDVYISGFAHQVPPGAHHVTFGVSEKPTGRDQLFPCSVAAVGERALQAGGSGSQPTMLPDGVAMPLQRGSQIFMNLHLVNLTDKVRRGRSGVWVKTMAKDAVEFESEFVGAGPLQLDIPIGRSTTKGSCTIRADATIYAVSPHMHLTGVHTRAAIVRGDERMELVDAPFDPYHALVYDVGSQKVKAGDRVEVECTYQNDTDAALHWGDSVLAEMCFVNLSMYPAIGYGSQPCSF